MDLSDPSVQKAITAVADLGSETRWALFSYSKAEAKSGPPGVVLVATGTGTLSELVSKLRADDIYYGYVRLVVSDATSVSTKFLFATYVGGSVSPLKRARVSVHKTVFAKSLPALNWEVFSEKLEELDEHQIITNFTKTSGYGGWALASKSAREANAAGTLRRKPKTPSPAINVDAALEEEKKIQAQAAVRKEEAKKRSGKRLDVLKQQKSLLPRPGQTMLTASGSAPAATTTPASTGAPANASAGVYALLARAEAEEKSRQAEAKRIDDDIQRRRLEVSRSSEESKAKAATAELDFKRAATELAEKKRTEEALQRQAEAAAAAKKAAEDANAVAVAAAAAAKKAAEDAQAAAANAAVARKAAEDAAERRRQEEAKRQEEETRKEKERKDRKDREERERREKKDKERKEKSDARDRKDRDRKEKTERSAPSTPAAPPPSTPVIIAEETVTVAPLPKSPTPESVASPPKSPAPKVRKIMGIGQGATQGHRPDMEDRHVALSQLPFDPDTAFVAVYDGHGGSPAAEYCKTVLHTNVTRDPNYKTDIHKAIVNGFLKTDAEFLDVCRAAELEAGCTANSVFITPTRLIVANAGDCRCILSRAGKVHLLSRDHKPYDATEKKRIELAGYFVEDNRVDGRLAVSRAVGDIDFKQAKGKSPEQQAVTALPEIIDEEREDDDEFLVVACDGLWDVLENEGVLEFVATRFELMSLDQIAQELVDYAVEIGSMDNTTAVIVRFK